ncbi:tol-pal system YbgF family protein [Flavobacterium sp.]|uniref:tetratricopeptide repeat protein n=1 Tax=Flavobacterium sp. TaxID=239 RepID=UPI003750E4BD
MKILFLLWIFISSVSFGQSNYNNEDVLNKRANDYSRAFFGNNRHELPTAAERKLMKNKDQNVKDYASKKALECFEYLIENFPSSKHLSNYYYQLGNIEYQMNSLENSKISLNKSIEANNLNDHKIHRNTYVLLAKISIDEKKFDKALTYLNEINKNRPEFIGCRTGIFPEENEINQLYEIIQINLEQN